MARSIHTTRKDLREARLRSYRDEKIKATEVAEAKKELARKRSIKESILDLRRAESVVGPTSPVPIRVLDNAPHIFHAATAADIEAIQERLPPGVMEGLSEIVFSLGEHIQLEGEDSNIWDPDPITSRIGVEILPGFYKGRIWGTYDHPVCRITLHAFVFDPSKPTAMPTVAYFKLQILSTFVHEVAHHFDHTQRVARGRWLAHEEEKVERFADDRQHAWTQTCVVPYLEEAYPHDVAELLQWLEVNGAVRFSLGELIPDRRHFYVSTIQQAVEELLKDVQGGTNRIERLFSFAVNLKIADLYERAQEVINNILATAPKHEDALELRASIWNFQGQYAMAAPLALQVLASNPRNHRARITLTRAHEGLEQWAKVIETTTDSLTVFDDEFDRLDALASRCSAYWKLGKQEESNRDLTALQNFKRTSWRVKRILRDRERAK